MSSLDPIFRAEHGRILATLIRSLGDWQLAEDALMDAFAAALQRWPEDGTPDNPGAWLTATARRKAIDRLRRAKTRTEHAPALTAHQQLVVGERRAAEDAIGDDRLSLIFTCCHPALAAEARIALTLRCVGGLTTREVARAFLVAEPTMAKRLVRAKRKIGAAGIPYRVPEAPELPDRLGAVCRVLYLIFSEGYAATEGQALIRRELCEEAIRLTAMLGRLLPDEPEVPALRALMLLTHARRDARLDAAGELVLLQDQDRARWDEQALDEGRAALQQALRGGQPGPFVLQACIAELHTAGPVDWPQIAALYTHLALLTRSPVVRLNRAVAVAMATDPAQGLRLLDGDLEQTLGHHHRYWAARADLLRRLGRWSEAAVAYAQARDRANNEPERRYLQRRLDELTD